MTTPDNPAEACPKCGAPLSIRTSNERHIEFQCGTVARFGDMVEPSSICDYAATLRAQLAAAGIGEAAWRVEREDLLARIEAAEQARDEWARQCNMASESLADMASRLSEVEAERDSLQAYRDDAIKWIGLASCSSAQELHAEFGHQIDLANIARAQLAEARGLLVLLSGRIKAMRALRESGEPGYYDGQYETDRADAFLTAQKGGTNG